MLADRIVQALAFRPQVYRQVKADPSFTNSAWLLVTLVILLNRLGTPMAGGLLGWVLSLLGALLSFALAVWITSLVGRGIFKTQATFNQLVRALGLASVWFAAGLLGAVGLLFSPLAPLITPINLAAMLLGLASWLLAARVTMELGWVPAAVSVLLGCTVVLPLLLVVGFILQALSLGPIPLY